MIRQVSLLLFFSLTAGVSQADNDRNTPAPYANDSSTEESVGFFSGLAVGAGVGGPVGAVAGAAIGAVMGDGWAAKKRVNNLQAQLDNTRLELAALQENSENLQRQYQATLQSTQSAGETAANFMPARIETPESVICCDNTVMSLYFRSGSSSIEEHEQEVIASFANLSNHMPDPVIEITGYADRNGDAEKNLRLSSQRAQAVRDLLAEFGLGNASIKTIAYGESRPLKNSQSLESDFFDRRVIIRLRDSSQVMLSRSTENQ